MKTLAIDIGGSNLKASVLDDNRALMVDRVRVKTPVGAPPDAVVAALAELVEPLPPFERISVGFPGVVRHGVVLTAPNLGNDDWKGFKLAEALTGKLGKPTKVLNDAEMQALAVIAGHGVEMVITLGTGFGTALFVDGRRGAHLELAHHPFRKGEPTTSSWATRLASASARRSGTSGWPRPLGTSGRSRTSITSTSAGATARRSPSIWIPM